MQRIDTVVALLSIVIPLVVLARRLRVPYPIVLVAGGAALGFAPRLPPIHLPPNAVLVVFLPPLLYWEAISAGFGRLRAQAGLVRTLVVGLVVATTVCVALVAHAIVPHIPWSSAFVLGAIVAPTDAVAFAVFARRLGLPHSTIGVVEAESLLNDATSLVIYASAVAAAVSGTFALRTVAVAFVESSLTAIVIGLVVGLLVAFAWHVVRDPDLQVAISVLAPFLAYLPAYRLGFSGVLAVVTAGIVLNGYSARSLTVEARRRSEGFWETIAFLMNALVFVLVGLQFRQSLDALHGYSHLALLLFAIAIAATVVVVRIGWIFAQRYVFRLPYRFSNDDGEDWKDRLIAGWSGFRGGVSLAAALAIPLTVADGSDFPRRSLTIFLTFAVIVVTLIGQGLTLPWLVARLRPAVGGHADAAGQRALARISHAALRRLRALERRGAIDGATAALLRSRYERREERFSPEAPRNEAPSAMLTYETAARELIAAQREELIAMQRDRIIDGPVIARVITVLDLEELELDRLDAVEAE